MSNIIYMYVYIYVKTYQIVHFEYMKSIPCWLYLNKTVNMVFIIISSPNRP